MADRRKDIAREAPSPQNTRSTTDPKALDRRQVASMMFEDEEVPFSLAIQAKRSTAEARRLCAPRCSWSSSLFKPSFQPCFESPIAHSRLCRRAWSCISNATRNATHERTKERPAVVSFAQHQPRRRALRTRNLRSRGATKDNAAAARSRAMEAPRLSENGTRGNKGRAAGGF